MTSATQVRPACRPPTQVDCRKLRGADLALPWLAPRGLLPWPVPIPGCSAAVCVKLASSRAEWEGAAQLVAAKYRARGYESGAARYRFTPYHALPDTVVLVAQQAGRVIATLTLVADNTLLGLPAEELYGTEVRRLRDEGRTLVETTCLADCGLDPRQFLGVFLAMMRLGWQYWAERGGYTSVITVNPRHAVFYTRLLGYLPLGPRRAYGSVNGHPAEGFYLDRELMEGRAPLAHEQIFGAPLPWQALEAPRVPAATVRHLARHSSRTSASLVEAILDQVAEHGSPRRW